MVVPKNQGRTLYEILTGQNKPKAMELRYYNPLQAKVGCTVSFQYEPTLAGINFVIEKITVYETKIGKKKFYHTDYHCKGTTVAMEGFLRFRLRLTPDQDANNILGCRIQVLHLYDEMPYDEDFYNGVLCNESKILEVNQDDEGKPLEVPRRYWRVEDVFDPYHAVASTLKDTNNDGKIDESEVEEEKTTYWDYARDTEDENGGKYTEFLYVEMSPRKYFTFLRGREVLAEDVLVF